MNNSMRDKLELIKKNDYFKKKVYLNNLLKKKDK